MNNIHNFTKVFIMKYLFWNRVQEITKAFCHESLELYGSKPSSKMPLKASVASDTQQDKPKQLHFINSKVL